MRTTADIRLQLMKSPTLKVKRRECFVKLNRQGVEEVYVAEMQILLKGSIGLIPLLLCSNGSLLCLLLVLFRLLSTSFSCFYCLFLLLLQLFKSPLKDFNVMLRWCHVRGCQCCAVNVEGQSMLKGSQC